MITTATRSTVSLASLLPLAAMLGLGACSRGPAADTWDAPAHFADKSLMLRFDNEAQTYVDVYLVTQQREWRLGRILPGARGLLRIPEAALAPTTGFVRLAVLADAPLTVDPAHDPRATFTIVQPASELLAQRWTFWKTPLASAEIRGAPRDLLRP